MIRQWFSVAGALHRQRGSDEGGGVGLLVLNGFVWAETETAAVGVFVERVNARYPRQDLIGVSARPVPTAPPPEALPPAADGALP
jgi:hypothetical protein